MAFVIPTLPIRASAASTTLSFPEAASHLGKQLIPLQETRALHVDTGRYKLVDASRVFLRDLDIDRSQVVIALIHKAPFLISSTSTHQNTMLLPVGNPANSPSTFPFPHLNDTQGFLDMTQRGTTPQARRLPHSIRFLLVTWDCVVLGEEFQMLDGNLWMHFEAVIVLPVDQPVSRVRA